jgi:fructosamine-3-kinase
MSLSIINKVFPENQGVLKLTGGDINEVYKVDTTDGQIVLKINRADDFPSMFSKEANGLSLIGQAATVPKVLSVGQVDEYQYLAMEFIQSGVKSDIFWQNFATDLSHLHQQTSEKFGLDESNFIGSLVQKNTLKNSWEEFLIEERLQPMVELAVDKGELSFAESKVFDIFYNRINEIYPIEKPALLHGDLWGGNYLVGLKDRPILIDPAVYYGHREMDIGMMHLFGGFDAILFDNYNEIYPLEKGWKNRIVYNQLYPLMVHVNLFGRTYWSQVSNILKKFTLT